MRKLLALSLVLALVPASSAFGRPLDKSFGSDGRVELKAGAPTGGVAIAATAEGGSVVAGFGQVVALTSAGRVDRSFGTSGRAPLPARLGWTFDLADVAVDSEQRIIVSGTSSPDGAEFNRVFSNAAIVQRLLPNGRPDRSFGVDGVVETTFGLPTPPTTPLNPNEPAPPGEYSAPSLEVKGFASDSKGRVVVAGKYVSRRETCTLYFSPPGTRVTHRQGFLARLDESGELDLGFGTNGLVLEAETSSQWNPLIDRAGRITFVKSSEAEPCPSRGGPFITTQLAGLDPSGKPRSQFDARQTEPLLHATAATRDAQMRTVMLGTDENEEVPDGWELERVWPTGFRDGAFGTAGRAQVLGPRDGSLTSIAADARSGVLVAGRDENCFYLTRITPKGAVDVSFGKQGAVRTPFADGSAWGEDLAIDAGGRVLLSGTVREAEGRGHFAVARFLLGKGPKRR